MAAVQPWQTCSWATYAHPQTLVPIGIEALACLHDHTIFFTDLKTKNKLYYTVDKSIVGAGASKLAGHYSLPIFAYSEAIMRPSIHVVRYPDFHKLYSFQSPNVISYNNLIFSNYDLLIALSGCPDYTLRIWNCRTGQFMAEHSTDIKCSAFSLQCSSRACPMIMQYSKFAKELIFWEMLYVGGATRITEISRVPLVRKSHALSSEFAMCFLDDVAYVVDDYGVVFSVEVAAFHLQRQWGTTLSPQTQPKPHNLHPYKHGLLVVADSQSITYITRKRNLWTVEWALQEQPVSMRKIVCNFLGDAYVSDEVGSLYQLQVEQNAAKLNDFSVTNFIVEEFTWLNGLKDENLLMLTHDGILHAVDVIRNAKFSELHIPQATCVTTHNALPFAVVGTADGKLHFISYGKVRTPRIVHVLDGADKYCIRDMRMADRTLLTRNVYNSFCTYHVDFVEERFVLLLPLPALPEIKVLTYFLIDGEFTIRFHTTNTKEKKKEDDEAEADMLIPYADIMTVGIWKHNEHTVNRQVVYLPKRYRSITMLQVTNRNNVEFVGVPMDSVCLDFFVIKNLCEFYFLCSMQTAHMGCITGVTGSRNLITYGVSTLMIHFRQHKRSPKPYTIARKLATSYGQRLIKNVMELYNSKYLVTLLASGCLKLRRLHTLSDNLRENVLVQDELIELQLGPLSTVHCTVSTGKREITQESRDLRIALDKRLAELQREVRTLIDYDITVTGKRTGIYRKFCLNQSWLDQLNREAQKLCEIERQSLMASIKDKTRIRDWIMNLITSDTAKFSLKVRAIFTDKYSFENYALEKSVNALAEFIDLYRFQDLEEDSENEEKIDEGEVKDVDGKGKYDDVTGADAASVDASDEDDEKLEVIDTAAAVKRRRKLFKVVGNSVFEHLMSEDFQVQDINLVTANQIYNYDIKFKMVLALPLREEFNKLFEEAQQYKQEVVNNILGINKALTHIYDDMNIMLSLLGMSTFTPPTLSVPTLAADEVLERIMTVDDSEIKAINRRAKKAIVSDQKHGRMLLWSFEFWLRALNAMMDGVLEKLWEEEIKKTPPEPEFMSKRQPHEYTLDDQKLLRVYEETLRALQEDRQKYLRILQESEGKTNDLKNNYIRKFNERCAEMAVLKLKYDFVLKHFRVRLLGLIGNFYERASLRNTLANLRAESHKADEYINRYAKLIEFSEKSVSDIKHEMETLSARDKQLERQFRGTFLANVPTFSHELTKLFRRRPKMLQRSFQSALVCNEVAARLVQKHRHMFPLPIEVQEYFNNLQSLDDQTNAPHQLDAKYWEQFVRLRRQKIENELKIKAHAFNLADAQDKLNKFIAELNELKSARQHLSSEMDNSTNQYSHIVQNQNLEIVLPLGQVEVTVGGSIKNLSNCILMSVDDVNAVNDLIKKAGAKKLHTMQRLAVFRRQVTYREWEHKIYRANIDYLKYMLEVIEKCKVSAEFLQLLRNWKKVKEERTKLMRIGYIDKLIEQRIAAHRKHLDQINEKIHACKEQILETKRKNRKINRSIDDIKVDVAMFNANRDFLLEEKLERERKESMDKVKRYSYLINEVRHDYVHILELKTILELQRLRTYPTLGPPPDDCGEN